MNASLDSRRFLKRGLVAGILALTIAIGPTAGMASAEPAAHECREHGKKSRECREHRRHGKSAVERTDYVRDVREYEYEAESGEYERGD